MPRRYTSKADLAEMFRRQNGKCKCGAYLLEVGYIIEHIQPLSRGGTDTLDNKCLNCKDCADKKTFHPRSKASAIGSDIFEAAKTKRLRGEVGKRKGKKMVSRPFPKRKIKWPKRRFGA